MGIFKHKINWIELFYEYALVKLGYGKTNIEINATLDTVIAVKNKLEHDGYVVEIYQSKADHWTLEFMEYIN